MMNAALDSWRVHVCDDIFCGSQLKRCHGDRVDREPLMGDTRNCSQMVFVYRLGLGAPVVGCLVCVVGGDGRLLVLVNRGCVGGEEDVFSGRRPELEDVSLFELVVAGGFYADAVDEGSVGRFEIHEVGLAVQASGGAVGEGPVLQDGVLAAARSVAERHVANVFVASQQIGRLTRNMECFNRIILVVIAAAAFLALLFLKDVETPLGVGCSGFGWL